MTNSRSKGKRAELEIVTYLNTYGFDVHRNLQQTQDGGYDILIADIVALEVKRSERSELPTWWKQAVRQAGDKYLPALAHRKNGESWRYWVTEPNGKKNALTPLQFVTWLGVQIAERGTP